MKKHPIGFYAKDVVEEILTRRENQEKVVITPKKSVVQVHFDEIRRSYAYYNDMFDLKVGDFVYVDGKLEGKRGRVTEVNYSFRIKLSDYKRVISVVDMTVKGELFLAGSHFISFDRSTIPYKKIRGWFAPPENDEEYVAGSDEKAFPIYDLEKMGVYEVVAEKGHEAYMDNRVLYVELDKGMGRAIVQGSKYYSVEFGFDGVNVSNLTCSCFQAGCCKHQFAVMLQLKEALDIIKESYEDEYDDYFATIVKDEILSLTARRKTGMIKVEI